MIDLKRKSDAPGLLVSVRNAAEAVTALSGGADIVDVKEPNRGALGAADPATIASIERAVDGRALVTAAMGELTDLSHDAIVPLARRIPAGVALFKIGLANCDSIANWQATWRNTIAALQSNAPNPPQSVAVVYADWRSAGSPRPDDVLAASLDLRCPALLVDTWEKASGNVFDHWPVDDLHAFLTRVREHQVAFVLAGSLSGASFTQAIDLAPDFVAVRGAACNGGRDGTVSYERVSALKRVIASSYEDRISGAKNALA